MGDKTGIEWCDATWNPTIGCSRISTGCARCYAEVQAARIVRMGKGKPTPYDDLLRTVGGEPRWIGMVRLVPERLAWPLTRRKPLRIFVNSMSDLFHESLSNEQIAAVFGVMAACPQHTFQILTKRARRMREWFEWVAGTGYDPGHVLSLALGDLAEQDRNSDPRFSDDEWLVGLCNVVNGRSSWSHHDDGTPLDGSRPRWPLPNVWMGVSVENQAAAIERIPDLERIPAAVRLLSIEPMLGPVDLERWLWRPAAEGFDWPSGEPRGEEHEARHELHWVIAGCESGPCARPAESAWYRSLRDQCEEAGVSFFLKQATEEGTWSGNNEHEQTVLCGPGSHRKPGGIIGAPYLDGVQHMAFPEVRRG